jgi:phage shock protein A
MNNNVWSVIITAITVLGGSQAFRYYEKRAMRKERDEEFIRHDCKDRIAKLEALLGESSKEKDELRTMVLELTKEVAALRVKVEFFEKRK